MSERNLLFLKERLRSHIDKAEFAAFFKLLSDMQKEKSYKFDETAFQLLRKESLLNTNISPTFIERTKMLVDGLSYEPTYIDEATPFANNVLSYTGSLIMGAIMLISIVTIAFLYYYKNISFETLSTGLFAIFITSLLLLIFSTLNPQQK